MLLPDGTAAAPADAPPQVQDAVWAANTIQTEPYRYGGGHRSFKSRRGYDCSGTVSFALNGGRAAQAPARLGQLHALGRARPRRVDHVYTTPATPTS